MPSVRGGYRKLFSSQQVLWGTRSSSGVSYPLRLSSVSPEHGALYEESLRDPEAFWGDLARQRLRWFRPFDQVMDCDMHQGRISWFNGGKINASGKSKAMLEHGRGQEASQLSSAS